MDPLTQNTLMLVQQLGDELDAARAFALALAERIHAAHEVLGRRAERRGWDGTEATNCVLSGDKP